MEYKIGSLVQTLCGEVDSDHNDNERLTAPGTWGYIESFSPRCGYYVSFSNGARVLLEDFELAHEKDYVVVPPDVMAQRLQEVKAIDDGLNEKEECPDGDTYNDVISIIL